MKWYGACFLKCSQQSLIADDPPLCCSPYSARLHANLFSFLTILAIIGFCPYTLPITHRILTAVRCLELNKRINGHNY